MSFNYVEPGTDVTRIRLEIGDTVDATASNGSLHDEEINDLVTQHGNWQRAVAPAARALAMKLSSQPTSRTVGELQIVQKRVEYLLQKAEAWEAGQSAGHATPSAGGLSLSQVEAWRSNPDRPRSVFPRPD